MDLIENIIKKVNTFQDLVKICSVNKQTNKFCKEYKKHIFLSLIKNKNFRKSFYDLFDQIIKKDTTTPKDQLDKMKWHHLTKLLEWYPVGNMFKETNDFQKEILDIFKNMSNDQIIRNQVMLEYFFKLAFYPSNYLQFLDDSDLLYIIDTNYWLKYQILDVWIFHLNTIRDINNLEYDKIINQLLSSFWIRYIQIQDDEDDEEEKEKEYIKYAVNKIIKDLKLDRKLANNFI